MEDTKDLAKSSINSQNAEEEQKLVKKTKPEEKPFQDFIKEDFIPSITSSLKDFNISLNQLVLKRDLRPVIGGQCWMVYGEISNNKKFWLCFSSDKITSSKHIAISEGSSEPSLLESFLIDESKITLPLLWSRLLQRLNGQKWLGKN